jgi:hypothetical protein
MGTCIIQPSNPNISPLIALTGTNSVLRDVTVDGADVSTGPNILITGVRAQLGHITSERAGTYGIYIDGGSTNGAAVAELSQVMALSNGSDGIRCANASDIYIDNGSQVENNRGNGVTLINCGSAHVMGNDISGNSLDGLLIAGVSTAHVSAYNNMIEGNTLSQNGQNDVEIRGWDFQRQTYVSLSNIISGNVFQGSSLHTSPANAWDAILIQDSGYNVVTGNVIQDPFGPATQFRAGIEISTRGHELGDVVTSNNVQTTGIPVIPYANTAFKTNVLNGTPQ